MTALPIDLDSVSYETDASLPHLEEMTGAPA